LKVSVEAVDGVVPLASPTLQLLPSASETRRASIRKNTNAEKAREGISDPTKPANLEDTPRRTAVDPQRLVQRPVEQGAVVAKLLPEPLLRLSLDEVGRRGVDVLSLLLQARCGSSER
jgi:hypothetical protein